MTSLLVRVRFTYFRCHTGAHHARHSSWAKFRYAETLDMLPGDATTVRSVLSAEAKSLSVPLGCANLKHILTPGRSNSTTKLPTSLGPNQKARLFRDISDQGNTWALIAAFFGFG